MKFDKRAEEIVELAKDMGLDFFPVIYETVEASTMYNLCSYGLPTRARHWSYGRSYDHQKMYGEMGYSKVYEIILNSNPSYAFMLDSNTEVQNLFIVGHCLAHSSFFKNNIMFQGTDRSMVSHAAEHAGRIDDYILKYGIDKVERIMDIGFALDDHIDWGKGLHRKDKEIIKIVSKDFHTDEFDDLYKKDKKKEVKQTNNKEKDLLWFFINNAPLEIWEQDVLDIIREEAYYFYPQKMSKIINEGWSCVCPESFMFSPDIGVVSAGEFYDKILNKVIDGNDNSCVATDYYNSRKQCLSVCSNKGYNISGAKNHKILVWENGERTWKELKDIKVGDRVEIRFNQQCWSNKMFRLFFEHNPKKGSGNTYKDIVIPKYVTEPFARFLGYFTAEGNIGNRSVVITNGEFCVVEDIRKSIVDSFGIEPKIKKDGNRYRVTIYSTKLICLLEQLGLKNYASDKTIPDCILQSPKVIVQNFLSCLFTGDGGAYDDDYILAVSSSSENIIQRTQLLLLNMGIISSIYKKKKEGYKDNYHLVISDDVMKRKFAENITTPSEHRRKALLNDFSNKKEFSLRDSILLTPNEKTLLKTILSKHTNKKRRMLRINDYFLKTNSISREQVYRIINILGVDLPSSIKDKFYDVNFVIDEIRYVSDVFENEVVDFTIPESHNYQAQGFVNHNSHWHAELMYNYDGLTDVEYLDFVRDHEKVVQAGSNPFQINPYFLGFRIFKDIEKRWDESHGNGAGREKIFEVMKNEDDISFIRNYLTEELIEELGLFTYGYQRKYNEEYTGEKIIEIKERIREDVVEALVSPLYNGGVPKIVVENTKADGTLVLRHESENAGTLNRKYASKTMAYIWDIWAAPIELYVLDDNGKEMLLYFDEGGYDESYVDKTYSFEEEKGLKILF